MILFRKKNHGQSENRKRICVLCERKSEFWPIQPNIPAWSAKFMWQINIELELVSDKLSPGSPPIINTYTSRTPLPGSHNKSVVSCASPLSHGVALSGLADPGISGLLAPATTLPYCLPSLIWSRGDFAKTDCSQKRIFRLKSKKIKKYAKPNHGIFLFSPWTGMCHGLVWHISLFSYFLA